ncbi:MAG: hypothetical protein LBJ16_00815 [Holosporaceae bacterium]|jgi:hypothetical protein|nr:hypothetical protein [Holosporaceae bacterium]
MARLMFFAHDPGGCNAILPLLDAFREHNHDVLIYAGGQAAAKIPEASGLSSDCLENILNHEKPDFIITGTSSNDFTEKFLWETAKNFNIPSLAVLDHWCNYGIRFSKYCLKEISSYNSDKSVDFLPSFICVMDDFAKAEMQNDGIPASIIHPLGNPHFGTLKNKSKDVDIAKIRSKFLGNNGKKKIVTFASEPYEEDYGLAPERKALEDIREILKENGDLAFVVKLHPKESMGKYGELHGVFFDREIDPAELIVTSDVVISMTSMFLMEACILGKKCLSYQPGEPDGSRFILTRNGVLPFVNNRHDLRRALLNLLNTQKIRYNLAVDLNATENIVKFVELTLCQS